MRLVPTSPSLSFLALALSLALTAGCSSSPPDGASASASATEQADQTFTPAPHEPFPPVVDNGGPILAHMKLVTVTFAGYPLDATVSAMGQWIVGSDYFAQVTSEYGVGAGTHQHIQLAETAPADLDPDAFMSQHIASGALPGADASDTEYLYVLVTPPGTTVPIDPSMTCAATHDIGGAAWHEEGSTPHRFAYAIIPTCGHEDLGDIEIGISHEIVEAATDPFPETAPGHQTRQGAWAGEIADLCDVPTVIDGFTVGTVWSNKMAALGGDPCLPAASVYFNVSAKAPALVDPGQTLTIDVTGWSTASRADWKLATFDLPLYVDKTFTPTLALSTNTINNGRTATLTVTIPPDAKSGSQGAWDILSHDDGTTMGRGSCP
jgi:hypothetical protein